MAAQTVIAEPQWDEAQSPTLDESSGAITAEVPYRVNSSETAEVYNAAGLPAQGQPYSGAFPNLICIGRSIRWAHGSDIDANDFGYSTVIVRYSTLTAQPEVLAAKKDDAFTSMERSIESVQVRADITGAALFEPTTKLVPKREIVVTAYRTNFPAAAWDAIEGKVNSTAIFLPPVFGSGTSLFTAEIGTLLALHPEIQAAAAEDLLQIRYRFAYSANWLAPQRRTDPDTQEPIGPITEFQIYETVEFDSSALWGLGGTP